MGCFLISLPETFKKCQKTCIVNAKNEKNCIPSAKNKKDLHSQCQIKKNLHSQYQKLKNIVVFEKFGHVTYLQI